MKKIGYLVMFLGVVFLGVGGFLFFSNDSLEDEVVDDEDKVVEENKSNDGYNNPLVCKNKEPIYDDYYMADTNMALIYDYDDTDTTVQSLTSTFSIVLTEDVAKEGTAEMREEARKELEKRECLSGGREYTGVSKSCSAEWVNDTTMVVTVEWDIDNPELEYGQDLPKAELKEMLENESEYSGILFCE